MISKHIFESTFSLATAQALKIWGDANLIDSDNPYLEEVIIPDYDSGNSDHILIDSLSNCTETNLNSHLHTYFAPLDYSSKDRLNIHSNGSDGAPRTFSLHNGNDFHPGALPRNHSNVMSITFEVNANYVVFDRITNIGEVDVSSGSDSAFIIYGEHNVFNRMLTNGVEISLQIEHEAHNNTVQNCRFEDTNPTSDAVAINLMAWDEGAVTHIKIFNTKIIRNEFKDVNDGFQLTIAGVAPDNQWGNGSGTIVNDNDFFLTTSSGCENGTDTKFGTPNPNFAIDPVTNPDIRIKIHGNRYWGYTQVSGDGTDALIASMHSPGFDIYDNVLFDCLGAIDGGGSSDAGNSHGWVDTNIYNNIIYQCGDPDGDDYRLFAIANGSNVNIHDNFIIEPQNTELIFMADNQDGSVFEDNKVVGTGSSQSFSQTDEWKWGGRIASCSEWDDSLTTTYSEDRALYLYDYVFTKNKFTDNPTEVTLPNVLKTPQ